VALLVLVSEDDLEAVDNATFESGDLQTNEPQVIMDSGRYLSSAGWKK
jgi:hypothetical protein